MDNGILRDVFTRKRLGPATKRQLTEGIVFEHKIPVSRTCKLVLLPRSQFYYIPIQDDAKVIQALQDLAFKHSLKASESYLLKSAHRVRYGIIKRFPGFISY